MSWPSAVGGATMLRRAVLWQATTLLLVSGTLDVRYYTQRRLYTPGPQVECFDYSEWAQSRYTRGVQGGWAQQSRPAGLLFDSMNYPPPPLVTNHLFSRRVDVHPSKADDVVKEHAKLVQDINGLKQVLYVAPMMDRTKDYDDSIYLEAIETTTTTPRPTSTFKTVITRSKKPGSSIPVILVGGASQRNVIKSQPLRIVKPTVSLVGTSVSPLAKHPYRFAMQPSAPPPVRVCMPTISQPSPLYNKPKPNLLQRILNGIISR